MTIECAPDNVNSVLDWNFLVSICWCFGSEVGERVHVFYLFCADFYPVQCRLELLNLVPLHDFVSYCSFSVLQPFSFPLLTVPGLVDGETMLVTICTTTFLAFEA